MHRREVRYSVRGDINVYREEWLTQLKRMVNEIQNLVVCTNMTQTHGKKFSRRLSK
jgi:ribosomal protein S24E